MAQQIRKVAELKDFADTLTQIGGGWRTTFVYVNMASIKKTAQSVDLARFGSKLDNDADLDQDVSDRLRQFAGGEQKRSNRFPFAGIVKVAKYTLNWQTARHHKDQYEKFVKDSDELSARYAADILKRQGLPLTQDALDSVQIKSRAQRDYEKREAGKEVKPRKDARVFKDYGKGGMYVRTNDFDKNGNNRIVIPQNMKNLTRGGTHYYLINDDGSIAGGRPVSESTIEDVLSKSSPREAGKASVLRKMGAEEQEIVRYLKEFEALNWSEYDFMADSFIYAIASSTDDLHSDEVSKVIFFNKELVDEIVTSKETLKINPQEFLAIAKQEINSTYGISVESKQYIANGIKKLIKESQSAIRLNGNDIKQIIRESINLLLAETKNNRR